MSSDTSPKKKSPRKSKKDYYETFIRDAELFIQENQNKISESESRALSNSDQSIDLSVNEELGQLPPPINPISEPILSDDLLKEIPTMGENGTDDDDEELENVINGINNTQKMLKQKNDMYNNLQKRFLLEENVVRGQMQECEKIVRKFEKRVMKYKSRLAQSRGELSKKNTSILTLQRKINSLKSRRMAEREDMEKIIEEKETLLKRKQGDIEKERSKKRTIENDLRHIEYEKQRLEKEMKRKEHALNETFNEIDMGLISAGIDATKIDSRRKKIEVVTSGLKEVKKHKNEVEVMRARIKEQEEKLIRDTDLKKKLRRVAELDRSMKQKDRVIRGLRRREKNRSNQMLDLTQKVSNLSRHVLDKEKELDSYRDDLSKSMVMSNSQSNDLGERERKILLLSRENKQLKERVSDASTRVEIYRKKGLDLKGLIGRLYKEYLTKKKEIKVLTKQLELLSSKYRFTQNVLIVLILIVAFFFAIHSVEFL